MYALEPPLSPDSEKMLGANLSSIGAALGVLRFA
ncbi:protein of unknown function [Methylocella tundrae]|uniref:Uncharacterized protein n=1 Tax=Methylocella tundrae TaxID=227605 RepID=A0A4U8YX88_METTU|nr:protein of unknown function [Methylocella tundrae]